MHQRRVGIGFADEGQVDPVLVNVQVTRATPRIQDAGAQIVRIQGPDGEELLPRPAQVRGDVGCGIHSMYSPRC